MMRIARSRFAWMAVASVVAYGLVRVFPPANPGLVAAAEADLSEIRGLDDGYQAITGGDYCSAQNLEGTQVSAYGCPGNGTSTCVKCVTNIEPVSAIANSGYRNNIQPSGGADVNDCGNRKKFIGTCTGGPSYQCGPPLIDTTVNCVAGGYPPFIDQGLIGFNRSRVRSF
ncbi:MAG: hypothetical protein U0835_12820 [Isosphaeraceae bacterium]